MITINLIKIKQLTFFFKKTKKNLILILNLFYSALTPINSK